MDTLGTITLLASDKTGTLTMNRMTVVDVWMNGKRLSTQGAKASYGAAQEVGVGCARAEWWWGGGRMYRFALFTVKFL